MRRHTIALALVLAVGSLSACAEYTTTGVPADQTGAPAEQTAAAQGPSAIPGDPMADQAAASEKVAETVVGLTAEKAEAAIVAAGLAYRVISVDGEPMAATADYRPDRINVALVDDKVETATVG